MLHEFRAPGQRRACPPRPAELPAGHGRNPGVHAGGHLRHGQGHDCRESVKEIGAEIILGNTFHLWLRPGTEVIEAHGDLHDFMHWDKPILTDSGGFQVFSLARLRKITEEGVHFRSPVDGAKVFMGPEESMEVQRVAGLGHRDDLRRVHALSGRPRTRRAARWSCRCAGPSARSIAHGDTPSALFGIVQGGMYAELRKRSLEGLERDRLRRLCHRRAVGGRAQGRDDPRCWTICRR